MVEPLRSAVLREKAVVLANSSFERLAEFRDTAGKTATVNQTPGLNWLKIFYNVAQTGEPAHFEQYVDVDYWFDLSASRLDGDTRHIIVVFNITERKRAEEQLRRAAEMDAFRVKLSDALRSLTDPIEI